MLDLSLQWRFANLPNNAKLEMVPISRSREGPENMVGSSAAARLPVLLFRPLGPSRWVGCVGCACEALVPILG